MDVKNTLKQITELEDKLNEYFDGLIYEVIQDMTTEYWTVFNEHEAEEDDEGNSRPFTRASDVGWSSYNPVEDNPDPDREHVYLEEVQSVVRKGEFTLVCIRTSTGDGCEDLIFDNSKEITEKQLNP